MPHKKNEEKTEAHSEEIKEKEKLKQEVKVEDEFLALKKENEELNDKLLRQLAEFDNFRKRTSREKLEMYKDATANCIENLLGFIDDIELACEQPCKDEEYKKGILLIKSNLMSALEKLGVKVMESTGAPFSPDLHNAVTRVKSPDTPADTVTETLKKGYMLDNKVIRHAIVAVSE